MNTTPSQDRATAEREAVIGYVTTHLARPRRRAWAVTGLIVAGALAGGGVSTAAFAASGTFGSVSPQQPSGQPIPDLGEAIAAPPGTSPGAPVISMLAEPTSQFVSQDEAVSLADRPADATHLRITVVPMSTGMLNFGTDPGGNNASAEWSGTDNLAEAIVWYDNPLDATTDTFYLTPDGGFTGTVTLQYVVHVPTHLGVNAAGQTFGVEGGPDGTPDLILVTGRAPDGSEVTGYARNADLFATSPDHPGRPENPEQALQWQAERDLKYPNGWDIPVFEQDGTTQIGVFHVSQPRA
jgi:hypothetical protein